VAGFSGIKRCLCILLSVTDVTSFTSASGSGRQGFQASNFACGSLVEVENVSAMQDACLGGVQGVGHVVIEPLQI